MTQPAVTPPARHVPGQQPGRPSVRVEATGSAVHPYALQVGDHAGLSVPMTAVAVRHLRDALTAVLAGSPPAEPDDFITEWARTYRAAVVTAEPAATDAA
ncbi:hypothetical protein [Actinoplanes teichomyceticus]|uniref:Uncharacterized protein n=1 Tax=Actinoplanes teichomyceticus TaxID=1867 RepID=A0A561VCM1_ACTTI|nr:hypothetical protein [Actinoplanes teichomyceticus]TWG09365.1 hypothetical protein FHX34_10880 [Actinoplanes teichomyceticus]GIF17218.1 hypothetical protein Ate01nite_72500 [Actinoplanes teichomyceticus]